MSSSLSICIVGSGPSAFFAIKALLRSERVGAIHILERLPAPFGLVRHGVAPDHPNIKRVTGSFTKLAASDRVTFFGNVEVGRDVSVEELSSAYSAVVWAVGCEKGRKLGVPGEDLPGVFSAAELVYWYNGHPDYRQLDVPLADCKTCMVVGNGNVAMDVARVLTRAVDSLAKTDIADHALSSLGVSTLEQVVLVGRRGPVQAAYSHRELEELGSLANLIVQPEDLVLDKASGDFLAHGASRGTQRSVSFLRDGPVHRPGARTVELRFLTSPRAFLGSNGRLTGVELVRNELVETPKGIRSRPTGEVWTVAAEMVVLAVGYRGSAIAGLPFDERRGVIPNRDGRVFHDESLMHGHYVVGWAKRGPTGLIGTNGPDATATVAMLLADAEGLIERMPSGPPLRADARPVSFDDWLRLDEAEKLQGAKAGRSRVKMTSVEEMLRVMER
jgi:ferredoxin/flavodoxin---NADP+ reductase